MRALRLRDGGSESGHSGEVFSCVYSSDGAFVLSGGWDGCLHLWLSANAQPISSLQASPKPLSSCAFTPDGTGWVSSAMDGTFSYWDAITHQLKLSFIAHIRPISAIQFSPDGRLLATASWDRKLMLRRVGEEREGQALVGHHDIVAGCRWTADGKQLLSWSHDGTLRLWDAGSAQEMARLEGHADRVISACLSKDGNWAISGSRDGSVKLWDLQRYKEARSVQLNEEVRGCWYLGDSCSVVTVNADGRIVLWSLPDLEVQAELASNIRALCGDLAPSGTEIVLGSEKGNLHCVIIEGIADTPIRVTPTPRFKPRTGVITRFLGKQRIEQWYQYSCPACGHIEETNRLPSKAIPCPSCQRLLQISTEARQLQPQ
jgi:WD40 repeat protein